MVSDPPAEKWGFRCLACKERIKPFGARIPVKGRPIVAPARTLGDLRTIGFRHPGCELKA